jgi:hypothetical protein
MRKGILGFGKEARDKFFTERVSGETVLREKSTDIITAFNFIMNQSDEPPNTTRSQIRKALS